MPRRSRTAWELLEPIHAVTYFAPECREGNNVVGLKGFWMGYFAARAAPMGEVGPEVVESAFFNFAPVLVRRAIPDAWQYARAADVVNVRASAAAMALRRIDPDVVETATAMVPALRRAVDGAEGEGLPLFDGNRAVTP